MTTAVRHPLFARGFDQLIRLVEREAGTHRAAMLAGASGRVVEIGAGNGMNFSHYPPAVDDVVALEPEPYLRARAEEAARSSPVPVTVTDALAEELPLDDGSFDTAVASLVLCSVPDPSRALAELRRVLRPGGELRFYEHVRSDAPRKARLQTFLDGSGVWPRLAGGCHCARDTISVIKAAGFDVARTRPVTLGPSWSVMSPHLIGAAVLP
jgi:ubiquinone/menaquinone biosynthesis C-methylase UbiE